MQEKVLAFFCTSKTEYLRPAQADLPLGPLGRLRSKAEKEVAADHRRRYKPPYHYDCVPYRSPEGATDHRRGCKPPYHYDCVPYRSPEGAKDHCSPLNDAPVIVCRPFRAFIPYGSLPGAYTPVCGLSHLRCFLPDTNNKKCKEW